MATFDALFHQAVPLSLISKEAGSQIQTTSWLKTSWWRIYSFITQDIRVVDQYQWITDEMIWDILEWMTSHDGSGLWKRQSEPVY